MNRILILVAIVAASLSLGAGAANAVQTPAGCNPNTLGGLGPSSSGNYAEQLFGTLWWMGTRPPAPVAVGVPCDSPVSQATIGAAVSAQARFYVLYRAFPKRPTARQWKARYGPLVKQAIIADQTALSLVLASESANLQAELIELDCGPPHHPVGHCDNNDPAPTCACSQGMNGENQDIEGWQTDLVALQKIAGLTLTSAKALDRGP